MLPDCLEGAIDLHVHSSPDLDERRYDDFELAREAARAGMAAVLLKSHQNSTVERAILVSKIVAGIRVYGGLVLNQTVGGLNPAAVSLALEMGARQIWMPTRSARNHRAHFGQAGGISILDSDGGVLPEVEHILALMAGSGCALGTGHLSPEETQILAAHARRAGVAPLLVTHPEWKGTFLPVALQRELSAGGGVLFERCFVSTTARCGCTPVAKIAGAIADVGAATTVLSTDLGQPDTPPPAEGLRQFAGQLRACGFSVEQLRVMMVENPARVLERGGRRVRRAADLEVPGV
jgi:hypothetical protein